MPPAAPSSGAPQQYPPQYQQQYPPQYQQQMPQPMPPPGPKKSNALVWILVSLGILAILVFAAFSVGSYLLYRTVKNAGFDPDLMRKNPGLAVTKMVTALHPDMQVVSSDDSAGTVTVREKSTGKVITFRFDPDKKTLVMVGDDGKEVKVSASGDAQNGTVQVENGDATVRFGSGGAGNSVPAWAPVYPGTTPQGTFSAKTGEGSQNTYTFKTHDSASKVLDYFKQQLTSAGFKVAGTLATDQGGMVQATDQGEKRTVMITANTSSDGTEGSITTIEKK
jgi:hypothetical protein